MGKRLQICFFIFLLFSFVFRSHTRYVCKSDGLGGICNQLDVDGLVTDEVFGCKKVFCIVGRTRF